MLISGILNAAGSLLNSSGVLVPGAGLVVDLCRWVGERVTLVKEGREAAAKLNEQVVLASKNLKRRICILEDCENALAQLQAHADIADLTDAVGDFHKLLPSTMAILTRAGQISNVVSSKGQGTKKPSSASLVPRQ